MYAIFQHTSCARNTFDSITSFGLVRTRQFGRKQVITLEKNQQIPKFPQNLRPISLLSTSGKLFEQLILRTIQNHIEENLLTVSYFCVQAHHSMTIQTMRLANRVTENFNNNLSMNAVFLDIEKAFDTTGHSGLLFKLSEFEFSTSLIKLIASLLTVTKFKVSF
jgi:hypothetical protein